MKVAVLITAFWASIRVAASFFSPSVWKVLITLCAVAHISDSVLLGTCLARIGALDTFSGVSSAVAGIALVCWALLFACLFAQTVIQQKLRWLNCVMCLWRQAALAVFPVRFWARIAWIVAADGWIEHVFEAVYAISHVCVVVYVDFVGLCINF